MRDKRNIDDDIEKEKKKMKRLKNEEAGWGSISHHLPFYTVH